MARKSAKQIATKRTCSKQKLSAKLASKRTNSNIIKSTKRLYFVLRYRKYIDVILWLDGNIVLYNDDSRDKLRLLYLIDNTPEILML